MQRSEINKLISDAIVLLDRYSIKLPPFAYWTPEDWATKGAECDEIRICKLGWDITDFGSGSFDAVGLVVFTVRNGHHERAPYNRKSYAEKVLIVREGQHTPMHYHRMKSEDIICRSGGNLFIRVFNRDCEFTVSNTDVEVSLDGVRHKVRAGHIFRLTPGMSITLPPNLFHEFWGEEGSGTSIVGEVSTVNDDDIDNNFRDQVGRFPKIVEDEPARYRLCTEYQ